MTSTRSTTAETGSASGGAYAPSKRAPICRPPLPDRDEVSHSSFGAEPPVSGAVTAGAPGALVSTVKQ
ncbi:hypothetical protein [Streptomyces gardneri]|uniref:hypothetical protein n=1 Tax=Streptomyces gardneri TaxID=66892 RepID=UPI0033D395AD